MQLCNLNKPECYMTKPPFSPPGAWWCASPTSVILLQIKLRKIHRKLKMLFFSCLSTAPMIFQDLTKLHNKFKKQLILSHLLPKAFTNSYHGDSLLNSSGKMEYIRYEKDFSRQRSICAYFCLLNLFSSKVCQTGLKNPFF